MAKKRGCAKHACSVSWVKKDSRWTFANQIKGEGQWVLYDLVCDGHPFYVWNEDEIYLMKAERDAPIDDVITEVLETTYLNPCEITVYDPFYEDDGFCPRREYDRNGVWLDEGESYSQFTEKKEREQT